MRVVLKKVTRLKFHINFGMFCVIIGTNQFHYNRTNCPFLFNQRRLPKFTLLDYTAISRF